MAKVILTPRISDIWKLIEPLLHTDEEHDPHLTQTLTTAVAQLEKRDQELEGALLGDLIVNNVAGSVGTVSPARARQIGWSSNFGFVTGTSTLPDMSGKVYFDVVYDTPFATDTAVVMLGSVLSADPTQALFLFLVGGSATKTGFQVAGFSGGGALPVSFCFCAIGF